MDMRNNNSELAERNMTKIFMAVFIGIIIVLLAVVIIMLGIKMDNDKLDPQNTDGSAESDLAEDTTPPAGSVSIENDINMPELKIISVEEQGKDVIISSTYCNLKYPLMFTDLINVDAYYGDGTGCLMFTATINEKTAPIYAVLFNSTDGVDIGTLKIDGATERVRVSVVFYDPSEEIQGDDQTTYYAAQETFNDIAKSLEDCEEFEPAY